MPATKKRKIKPSKKANPVFWPCGICRMNCQVSSICCDLCNSWYHPQCENLTLQEFEMFAINGDLAYTCNGCFRDDVPKEYCFTAALNRLTEAGKRDVNFLRFACKREQKNLPVYVEVAQRDFTEQPEHLTSKILLSRYNMNDHGVPLESLTDGSCLFSAASISLVGDNRLTTELRVRTCIEMLLNEEKYTQIDSFKDILTVSPTFKDSCLDCSQSAGFSSQWTIYALCSVIICNIKVVYPPVNGTGDLAYRALNTICTPSITTNKSITVMWTSCSPPDHTKLWSADHFVPLIKRENISSESIFMSNNISVSRNKKTSSPLKVDHSFSLNESSLDDSSNISNIEVEDLNPLPESNDTKEIENNGKFLDSDELIEILLSSYDDVRTKIPRGLKENIAYIVDNSANVQRELAGKRRKYVDDCGVWGSVSLKTHYYVRQNNQLKYAEKQNDQYVTSVKNQRIPIDPQPDKSDVVILRRAYSKLKRCPSYQRRFSWVVSDIPKSIAYVEYIGEFPKTISLHGNNKSGHGEYVRTTTEIIIGIKEKVSCQKSREIYTALALDDSMEAPRDLKQVQNFKYNEKKKARPRHNSATNNADDVQTLINMQHDHSFMKEIVQLAGKPPSVILYTDEQLQDLKKFCTSESKQIIGVDRTFNLGATYVTLTVFHNYNLIRKISNNPPIMMGPCYLHWDGTYHSYHRFFSHLQCFLDDVAGAELSGKNLVFGSDEEKAITKAIKKCFPESQQILCTRHVEENFKRHLRQLIGEGDSNFKTVMSDIFGADGLLHSADDVEFDLKVLELESKYENCLPAFRRYFTSNVDSLKSFVWMPSNKDIAPVNWKNNSCESMNHILKLSTNWQAVKLPELIDTLHRIVQLQYRDMRRALHGQGNYALAPWVRKLQVTEIVWASKTESEKNALFQKFMNLTRKKENFIQSSDGMIKIPKTPTTARKPNQKKRVKSNKTTTLKFS